MNYICVKTEDNVYLEGLIYNENKKTDSIVISVHGMATNCIKDRDNIIADKLKKINIDYLVFNNRGHDLVSYAKREVNGKRKNIICGTAYEEISDCYFDIKAMLEHVLKKGYKNVYILGHSLGCTKTIYTYNKLLKNNETGILNSIKGIILLSLVDIPMTLKTFLQNNFNDMTNFAEEQIKKGNTEMLMPKKAFIHPISVKTFLRYAKNSEDINFARFSEEKYDYPELNNIKIPLFMRWGNERELILQEPQQLCNTIKNKLNNKNVDIGYIDGANHSYRGKEVQLAEEIFNFINKYTKEKS